MSSLIITPDDSDEAKRSNNQTDGGDGEYANKTINRPSDGSLPPDFFNEENIDEKTRNTKPNREVK